MRKLTHQPLSRIALAVFGVLLGSSGFSSQAAPLPGDGQISPVSYPELLPDTHLTLLSSFSERYPADVNWTPDCSDPASCAKYTGTESDMINTVDAPQSGGSDYTNSLSPFADGSAVGNHEGKTLLVSSLKDVQGFIFAYSNTNGYITPSYMPSAVAKNNTLVIDLGNVDGVAHEIRGVNPYNVTVASVAGAGIARGGAADNQILMRDTSLSINAVSGFGDERPGWHMVAATVEQLEENSSNNIAILDSVKLAMDPSKQETERNFVRVGALYAYSVDKDVSISDNTLRVTDSHIEADSLYGFSLYIGSGTVTAEGNGVYVEGSELWLNPTSTGNKTAGIYAVKGGDQAVGNWVEITDSSATIIQGGPGSSSFMTAAATGAILAEKNTLIVRDTSITNDHSSIFAGGYANQGSGAGHAARENAVFMGGTDSIMSITGSGSVAVYGGVAYMPKGDDAVDATNNSVSLTNLSAIKLSVYGGYVFAADSLDSGMRAESNDVVLANVETNTLQLIGGRVGGGEAIGNRSYVTGLKLHGDETSMSVFAGGRSDAAGVASDNHLYLEDSQIGTNVLLYGGYVGGAGPDAVAQNNLVVIGSNVTGLEGAPLTFVNVFGGVVNKVGVNDGNRLVTASRFQTEQLGGFQHYEFSVSQERLDEGAFITVTGNAPVILETEGENASTVGIGLSGEEELAPGSYTLINASAGFARLDGSVIAGGTSLDDLKTTVTTTTMPSIVRIETTTLETDDYDLALNDSGKDLVMSIKNPGSSWSEANPETDALIESSLSSYGTLFAADDLFVDTVMRSRTGGHDGLFAAARAGTWDLDSRGDTDTTIVSGLVGYAAHIAQTEFGGFIEMGHATYDVRTYNGLANVSGAGKHNYAGVGLYVNQSLPVEGWQVTAYLKGGAFSNRYDAQLAGVTTELDRTRAYWGAHLGTHFDYQIAKLRGRAFISYFYDGVDSMSFNVKGHDGVEGARFEYDALNAHRVQLGSLFEYDYSPTHRPYFGFALEQTLKAEASGQAHDSQGEISLRSSDLEGTTGILSAGWTYEGNDGFSFEFGLNGYAGTRNGVSGQIQGNWKF